MNLVFLNGELVPADAARVSLFDRGFLYGDGLFETVRIQAGQLFRWTEHLARLERGLDLLRISPRPSTETLTRQAREVIAANQCSDGALRVTISRGPGPRGYSPAGALSPTVALSVHPGRPSPREEGLRLVSSKVRLLAEDPLAAVKSASKLHHVLARAEADAAGADDALLINQHGEIMEASGSNIFWMEAGVLRTPSVATGLLPGIARGAVMELGASLGWPVKESRSEASALPRAEGVFLVNVISGPAEVSEFDGSKLRRSERVKVLRRAFEEMVQREIAGGSADA